jgi:dihydrofolate synthase/folylpolyglutamate synthase
MDYRQARNYMEEISSYGSVLGLTNMQQLLERLNHPEQELSIIHVAGTNGKGSVVSYLSTIYGEAGYRVGRYVSPTICKYRERIQINNRYIEKSDFAEGITLIQGIIEQMVAEGLPHPTPFEVETALALWYYKRHNCDLVILECGLGGGEDATNAIEKKICTVFASISMDHMGILGDSLEEIARTKAGIMVKDIPAVSMNQDACVEQVLRQEAAKAGAEFVLADVTKATVTESSLDKQVFSYEDYENLELTLAGEHQISNAVLALKVIETLQKKGFLVSREAIYQGFAKTKWIGRFTTIHNNPRIIVDGAHNEDAAKKLAKLVKQQLGQRKIIFLMGVFKDKEYEKIVKETAPLASQIITFTIPDNERALPAMELAYTVRDYNENVTAADSMKEALEMALLLAGKEDVILAFGSLSFIGRLMELMEEMKKKNKPIGV